MPSIFGTTITAVSYDPNLKQITIDGQAFAINQYVGVSDIQVSLTGLGIWSSVNTIDFWSDTQVIGSFTTALGSGSYDVRLISSDNEISNVLSNAFTITAGGIFFFFDEDDK